MQATISALAKILTLRPGMSSPNKSRATEVIKEKGSVPEDAVPNETIDTTTPKQKNVTAIGATYRKYQPSVGSFSLRAVVDEGGL